MFVNTLCSKVALLNTPVAKLVMAPNKECVDRGGMSHAQLKLNKHRKSEYDPGPYKTLT